MPHFRRTCTLQPCTHPALVTAMNAKLLFQWASHPYLTSSALISPHMQNHCGFADYGHLPTTSTIQVRHIHIMHQAHIWTRGGVAVTLQCHQRVSPCLIYIDHRYGYCVSLALTTSRRCCHRSVDVYQVIRIASLKPKASALLILKWLV